MCNAAVMTGRDESATAEGAADDDVRRILDAAWAALSRAGYENLKVQSVIRSAGVSTGSFYRRFSGKDELLLALITEEARRNTRSLDERTRSGDPVVRVRAWVAAAAGMGFSERAQARTRWFSGLPLEILQRLVALAETDPTADTGASLRRAISDGIGSGVFPHAQPTSDAAAIQAVSNRVATGDTRLFGQNREEILTNLHRFVLAALTNPNPRDAASTAGGPGASP
jgi:AcrR family transcriptional regulator